MLIALDTNFLVYIAKYKIDLLAELDRICENYKLVIPFQVIEELKKLTETGKLKDKEAAQLALQLLELLEKENKLTIKKIPAKDADSAILKLAPETIATLDKELKKRFKKVKILTIRQKKYLQVVD